MAVLAQSRRTPPSRGIQPPAIDQRGTSPLDFNIWESATLQASYWELRLNVRGEVMDDFVKILIVDDNEYVRRKIKRILAAPNRTFFEAANEEDSLKLIKDNPFDVIFLDVRLPFGVTGIDVYKKAKEIQPNLGKVIILTGWLEDNTRNEAKKLGAFEYLDKAPLDRNKIIDAFNRALLEKGV